MRARHWVISLFVVVAAASAQAASWPGLPIACTPERAAPWQEGKSEDQQAACHCPPTSMCPTTYEEYSDANKSPIPMTFVMRCCPTIPSPQCPAGTQLAGQPVPNNGECNPYCPAGTILVGQLIPADKNCNPVTVTPEPPVTPETPETPETPTCPVGTTLAGQPIPPGGECNVVATQCPAKYYPTLAETMTNTNFVEPGGGKKVYDGSTASRGTYTYGNGSQYNFDYMLGWQWAGRGQNSITVRMSKRYNWSLRLSDLTGWLWFGTSVNQYASMTGGIHTGHKLTDLINHFGMDNLSWFGVSVVNPGAVANNHATPEMIAEFGGRDWIELGNYTIGKPGTMAVLPIKPIGPAMSAGAGEFIQQCRNVAGEYVELEYKNFNGKQCAYLQCRLVYEDTRESCLSSDTKITLADGATKSVSELKVGDRVKSTDGDHKILATNVYQSALRVLYGINGGDAMLTGDHPIRTTDGWKVITEDAAKIYAGKEGFAKTKLEVGDVLVTDKGEVKVESITRFPKIDPVSTYNIKVDGNAGFFANGIEVKGFSKMEMQYE